MDNKRNSGLLGVLAGVAIGAAIGILFAPDSGKETRKKLKKKATKAKSDLDEAIEKGRAEWSKTKGKASDAASMTKDEVTDFVRFLFAEGRDLKDRLKDDIEDTADEFSSKAKRAADDIRHSAN